MTILATPLQPRGHGLLFGFLFGSSKLFEAPTELEPAASTTVVLGLPT